MVTKSNKIHVKVEFGDSLDEMELEVLNKWCCPLAPIGTYVH